MVGADKRQVSRWKGIYINGGVEALNRKGGGRNRENMSVEEEEEIINQFNEEAEAGKMIEVSEIRKAYEEKLGRKTHPTYIYTILHRHGWRKVKPRSRHPKKADDEAIEASKKLKQKFRN